VVGLLSGELLRGLLYGTTLYCYLYLVLLAPGAMENAGEDNRYNITVFAKFARFGRD